MAQAVAPEHLAGSRLRAGGLFALGAWGVAIAAALAGPTAATVAGLALFALGLFHGAADEQDGRMRRVGALHALAYLVTGAGFAFAILYAPVAGLVLFLALSGWHFARDSDLPDRVSRVGFALLATAGTALFRRGETAQVFAAILGTPVPPFFMTVLAGAGALGLVAALVSSHRDPGRIPVWLGLVVPAALFPPVLAVGLIFLIAHAAPATRRQAARYGWDRVVRSAGPFGLLALVALASLAGAVASGWLALPVAAAAALGLACPHMLTDRLQR